MTLPKKKVSQLQERYPMLGEREFYDSLLKHYQIRLYQLGLSGRYHAVDIMAETTLRLDRAFLLGQRIHNLKSWMRVTGFNYMYELCRGEQKYVLFDDSDLEPLLSVTDNYPYDCRETEYQILYQALRSLEARHQEILQLRFFEKRSWEEISIIFAADNKLITIAALRQRGKRAVDALRQAFRQLFDQSQ
jgi:DNA-directed RNA polymerase specialized sigma24 family protein